MDIIKRISIANTYIRVDDADQSLAFRTFLDSRGFHWRSGDRYTELNYDRDGFPMFYNVSDGTKTTDTPFGFTVITFSDLLSEYHDDISLDDSEECETEYDISESIYDLLGILKEENE